MTSQGQDRRQLVGPCEAGLEDVSQHDIGEERKEQDRQRADDHGDGGPGDEPIDPANKEGHGAPQPHAPSFDV